MEASAIRAGPGLGRPRISLGPGLLRLRSDQQLVALFREGNEDAFRVIHDRYRPRLLAYARQMLPGRPGDVEDTLQDVFLRTYALLRSSERELILRPWLYRVAHNRCVDELRHPLPPPVAVAAHDRQSSRDPEVETEQRESIRRLIVDIGRLPDQQRSALLMRELSGMAYADVAQALGISVPAVKSLLVRARIGLAQAIEARDLECVDIRRQLAEAHEEGVRPSWMARRHLRDCPGCRACRVELRASSRRLAALAPTFGPLAVLAKLFGAGSAGGGTAAGASGSVTAGAGSAAGGAVGAGTASGLAGITAGHVATILAAAVVTAGGAVAVGQTVAHHGSPTARHAVKHAAAAQSRIDSAVAPLRVPTPRAVSVAPHRQSAPTEPTPASTSTGGGGSASGQRFGDRAARQPASSSAPSTTASATTPGTAGSSTSTTCPPPPPVCTPSSTTACPASSGSNAGSPGTSSGSTTATTTSSTTSGTATATTASATPATGSTPAGSGCSTTTSATGTPGAPSASSGSTDTPS